MFSPIRFLSLAGGTLLLASATATTALRPEPPLRVLHAHDAADSLTPKARAQLAAARRAVDSLATPEAARAAGYRPMFGNVPLQGEHYVRYDLVLRDTFDLERPSVLMFAPVAGTPTLVGIAYAFLHPTDAPPPPGFDGALYAWHAHERLTTQRGKQLLMMHVWFAEAPEGPFARYNPWLPYLATGLVPPDARTLADSSTGLRARRLGLALASAETPPMIFGILDRQGGEALAARTAPHRDAIRALVPQLAAAERAGDRATYDRLAAEAIARGDSLVATYRTAAPDRPMLARLVDRTADEFLGRGHGIEEELNAMFGGRAPAAKAGHEHH